MKENLTDINVVLDRSGSMSNVADSTITGYNEFIKGQKAMDGEAYVTLAQFDNHYDVVYAGKNIQEVPELTSETFQPRGMTALLDAIGKTIVDTGVRLSNLSEENRPSKVIFLILTDGGENASKEFTNSQVSTLIKQQTETYSWEFVFVGANQDAISVGTSMGINAANSMTYAANNVGTSAVFASLNANTRAYRSGLMKNASFTDQDYDLQAKAGA